MKIEVMIVNPDVVMVEQGLAVMTGKNWQYVAAMQNNAFRGSNIIVTVMNRHGNSTQTEITIDNQCI